MKFVLLISLLFCIIGAVFSEQIFPNIGYIQCNTNGDPRVLLKCGQRVRSIKAGPFRFLNYSGNSTFRFSFIGSCVDGVEFARTQIPGCNKCDTLGNPPVDTIPICAPVHPF